MSAVQTTPAVDAFTAEVIRNAVVAITGEMKTNLMRTAYSSIIYEAEDFTVGLFDADGHTISIASACPCLSAASPTQSRRKLPTEARKILPLATSCLPTMATSWVAISTI